MSRASLQAAVRSTREKHPEPPAQATRPEAPLRQRPRQDGLSRRESEALVGFSTGSTCSAPREALAPTVDARSEVHGMLVA
ncbi:MAG: hypothetical protein ACKO6N_12185 [Myxococcota bacterium]